jgi:hypothetical protein
MRQWLVVVPPDRYATERLYHHDTVELSGGEHAGLAVGDEVALAAGDPLVVFGLGRVVTAVAGDESDPDDPDAPESDGELRQIAYTHRFLDDPVPWVGAVAQPGKPLPLTEAEFQPLARADRAVTAPRRSWLVGVELPIEAGSPAEAVRQFWSYVTQLGPRELPAFVSPADDELAMQAYVLGEEANLDPEEEE